MRIALATVFQLTNTFSRQPTSIDSFTDFNVHEPGDLPTCDTYGTQRFVNALMEAADERGAHCRQARKSGGARGRSDVR